MRWPIILILFCTACGVAEQPKSGKTVSAYEVPLPTEQDRSAFLGMLNRIAKTEGLHIDAASKEALEHTAVANPPARMTIHAAAWRGQDDDQPEAVIMDQADHLGQVWIMFLKGEDAQLAMRFCEKAVIETKRRWPNTLSLPITKVGTIPLSRDLIRTPDGYKLNPSAASRYEPS